MKQQRSIGTRCRSAFMAELHQCVLCCILCCVCVQGQGVARQRQAIITGLRDSVKDFNELPGISSKDGEQQGIGV